MEHSIKLTLQIEHWHENIFEDFFISQPSNVKYYGNAGFSIKQRLWIKYYCIKKAEMAGFLNLKAKEIYKLELITDYPRVIREQLDE